jgi:KaiC/GvpD/RAD55 family RecA-like ATPase
MENKVLSILLIDRQSWEDVSGVLSKEDFSDIGWLIVGQIGEYYKADPEATEVDTELLSSRVHRTHASMGPSVDAVLSNMQDVSGPNVLNEYVEMRLLSLSRRISHALANNQPIEETHELMSLWQELKDKRESALLGDEDNSVTRGFDIRTIMEFNTATNLVPIFPENLNQVLGGGAPQGTHIVVFARPEAGKTMFCVNMVANFIRAGKTALYAGNEDPSKAIKQRIISNLIGLDRQEMAEENEDYILSLVDQHNVDNLVFADLHPGTTGDIKSLVAEHRPDVVVVDQIRNLRTPKNYTKVESLEHVAQEMRNIAKEFGCVVISVTQAGDSADNKLELTMGDVDYSNTGIPSTADVMIGIGVTPMLEAAGMRRLSLPKNKLTGNHTAMDIHVNPRLSEVSG